MLHICFYLHHTRLKDFLNSSLVTYPSWLLSSDLKIWIGWFTFNLLFTFCKHNKVKAKKKHPINHWGYLSFNTVEFAVVPSTHLSFFGLHLSIIVKNGVYWQYPSTVQQSQLNILHPQFNQPKWRLQQQLSESDNKKC